MQNCVIKIIIETKKWTKKEELLQNQFFFYCDNLDNVCLCKYRGLNTNIKTLRFDKQKLKQNKTKQNKKSWK